MEKEQQDLGTAFRQKFENFEATPSPELWKAIEQGVTKGTVNIKKIVAVSAIVVVAVATVFFFVANRFSKSDSLLEAEIPENTLGTQNISTIDTTQIIDEDSQNQLGLLPATTEAGNNVSPTEKQMQPSTAEKINTKGPSIPELPAKLKSETINANKRDSELTMRTTAPAKMTTSGQETSQLVVPTENITPVKPEATSSQSNVDKKKETTTPTVKEPNPETAETPYSLFIPSAFTPDGPNNQVFKAMASDDVASFEMRVYDAKGKQVFVSKDITQGWTGANAKAGGYVYAVKCTNSQGQIFQKRGSVTLIRNY